MKTLVAILIFMASSSTLVAEIALEVRSAAFFPTSKRFRDIYVEVGACYQLEASAELTDRIDEWVNFDWFERRGHSIGLRQSTQVKIFSVSTGFKYHCHIVDRCSIFGGIGLSCARVFLKNFRQHERSRFSAGVVLKTGLQYSLNACSAITLFADYVYQPVHFHRSVDLGGLKLGAGLSLAF